jgi:hypothetical protein
MAVFLSVDASHVPPVFNVGASEDQRLGLVCEDDVIGLADGDVVEIPTWSNN